MFIKKNNEKEKLIKQLEGLFDSKFEKVFEGALEGFAYYFSRFDIEGLDRLLCDFNQYDGVSKEYYLSLINKTFNNLKIKGITSLQSFPGVCNGCINGCSGYTFIDPKTGNYVDIIIELEKSEITNFIECYDLLNQNQIPLKTERIVIKEFKVL